MINFYYKTCKSLKEKICFLLIALSISCGSKQEISEKLEDGLENQEGIINDQEGSNVEQESGILHEIDLNHWKVTLPIGAPIEVEPPEILNYANDEMLKDFMFDDLEDSSLVFKTFPEASTANSSYSRTELREQMVPGSNNTNWTFEQGGRMKGTLSVPDISKHSDGDFHRTIVMQVHGRLSNEQRDLIGEDDNNAPPVLKIYWQNGKIRIKTKVLKDLNATDEEILHTSAWGDDEGFTFSEEIGKEKFTLEILISDGRMEVILNETDAIVYDDIHMKKWSVFENYFKAGNYLQTKDEGSFATVKYFDLIVEHR
ncbi:MAG: polysaccharide lyase family 7 protein [Flavobacteriaceae bacterium]|nr:MAG: polysaccharide lyase family 7 protein [Flavobacteriaceae bacterium]